MGSYRQDFQQPLQQLKQLRALHQLRGDEVFKAARIGRIWKLEELISLNWGIQLVAFSPLAHAHTHQLPEIVLQVVSNRT